MDTEWAAMDQPLLMNVVNNFTESKCLVFELPGDGTHFDLLTGAILEHSDPKQYPTIVHITSGRVTFFDKLSQQEFIHRALLLDDADVKTSNKAADGKLHQALTMPVSANGLKHDCRLLNR